MTTQVSEILSALVVAEKIVRSSSNGSSSTSLHIEKHLNGNGYAQLDTSVADNDEDGWEDEAI